MEEQPIVEVRKHPDALAAPVPNEDIKRFGEHPGCRAQVERQDLESIPVPTPAEAVIGATGGMKIHVVVTLSQVGLAREVVGVRDILEIAQTLHVEGGIDQEPIDMHGACPKLNAASRSISGRSQGD